MTFIYHAVQALGREIKKNFTRFCADVNRNSIIVTKRNLLGTTVV